MRIELTHPKITFRRWRNLIGQSALFLVIALCAALTITYWEALSAGQGFVVGSPEMPKNAQLGIRGESMAANQDSYLLTFSSYLGGTPGQNGLGEDTIRDMATDSQGNIYLAGGTSSPDFPTTPGAYDTTFASGCTSCGSLGPMDVFVTKINSSGQIIWSTFIGGPNYDRAYAIEVDEQGYVYVAGRAGDGFPVTSGAFQTQFMGGFSSAYGDQDGFVLKLTPDGTDLAYASYIGSDAQDIARDLDIDNLENVYVIQVQDGAPGTYPQAVASAFTNAPLGQQDAVAAKIKSDGSQVMWAQYLGGSGADGGGPSIRVTGSGNAHALFVTQSDGIATTGVLQSSRAGGRDLFLAKLEADGSGLLFGSYLGGTQDEFAGTHNLALDSIGNAYVHATTYSADFPVTQGAFQTVYGGATSGPWEELGDRFISKISANGSQLLASTFLGGRFAEGGEGTEVDPAGNVYATGFTFSDDFPVTSNAFDKNYNGNSDAGLVKLSSDLSQLLYATYMGTSGGAGGTESFRATAVDPFGNFLVAGMTDSSGWPTLNAIQNAYAGGPMDAVVAKFNQNSVPPPKLDNLQYIPIAQKISSLGD